MKKLMFSLFLAGVCQFKGFAQGPIPIGDGILVVNPSSTGNCDNGLGEAMQLTQDDASGDIGIGICPTLNSVLTVQNFGPPNNSVVEIINGYANTSSLAPYSFSVARSTPPSAGLDLGVSSSGLVGIGVAAPKAHLDITDQNGDGLLLIRASPVKNNPFVVTDAGWVGINNANPAYTLDVHGNANVQSTLNIGIGGGDVGQINLNSPALPPGGASIYTLVSDPGVKAIEVQEQNQSTLTPFPYTDKFVVFADGRTAIGDFTNVVSPALPNGWTSLNTGGYMLYVNGGVLATKYKCSLSSDATNWSDYVFDKDYKLKSLSELEGYIKDHHHLPDVPSADDVACYGIDMADMDATLLKKIEELTLYVLDLKKDNEAMKVRLNNLKK